MLQGSEEAKRDALDGQMAGARNRYVHKEGKFPEVVLLTQMTVKKIGVEQCIPAYGSVAPNNGLNPLKKSGFLKRHYPNVDMYECPTCRAIVVRE
jgi:hypothetical protein